MRDIERQDRSRVGRRDLRQRHQRMRRRMPVAWHRLAAVAAAARSVTRGCRLGTPVAQQIDREQRQCGLASRRRCRTGSHDVFLESPPPGLQRFVPHLRVRSVKPFGRRPPRARRHPPARDHRQAPHFLVGVGRRRLRACGRGTAPLAAAPACQPANACQLVGILRAALEALAAAARRAWRLELRDLAAGRASASRPSVAPSTRVDLNGRRIGRPAARARWPAST